MPPPQAFSFSPLCNHLPPALRTQPSDAGPPLVLPCQRPRWRDALRWLSHQDSTLWYPLPRQSSTAFRFGPTACNSLWTRPLLPLPLRPFLLVSSDAPKLRQRQPSHLPPTTSAASAFFSSSSWEYFLTPHTQRFLPAALPPTHLSPLCLPPLSLGPSLPFASLYL